MNEPIQPTERLRLAEEAVELGEARFQRLTQALPVKIFTTDDEGCIAYVNDLWRNHGLHIDGHWLQEGMMHVDDVSQCKERWKRAHAEGTECECEIRMKSPHGGAERWNHVRIVPFQRAGGSRAGWVGTFVDLTESKERETALRMSEKLALTGRNDQRNRPRDQQSAGGDHQPDVPSARGDPRRRPPRKGTSAWSRANWSASPASPSRRCAGTARSPTSARALAWEQWPKTYCGSSPARSATGS